MGSRLRAVLVQTPAGSCNTLIMAYAKYLVLALALTGGEAARRLRNEKSLLQTFPFNAENGQAAAQPRPIARVPQQSLQASPSRQGSDDTDVSFGAIAAASAEGKKCIDKVEMVEETEYDETVQCDHSYDRRCHTTYVTNYESQQEEECDVQGPEICRTEYESECWTKQEEHDVEDDVVTCETIQDEKCEDETSGYTTQTKCSKWPREVCSVEKKKVKKYTPITGCTKEPRELCAPAGCGFKEGAEVCQDKTKTIVQDKPNEECSLEPQRTCAHVAKLVPKLSPTEECVDVPKEVCTRSKSNPRKVKKPVVKKWCYIPSEESGLA